MNKSVMRIYQSIESQKDSDGLVVVCTCQDGLDLFIQNKRFYVWSIDHKIQGDYRIQVPLESIGIEEDQTFYIDEKYFNDVVILGEV